MPKREKKTSLKLRHPQQYIFSGMANRFAIDREEGFAVTHFGLVNGAGKWIDGLSCVIPNYTIESQKQNLMQYLDQTERPLTIKPIPTWRPPPRETTEKLLSYAVVDFIHVANIGEAYAEICFWNYSQGAAHDLAKLIGEDSELAAFGVAMIRCDMNLQTAFLDALYEV